MISGTHAALPPSSTSRANTTKPFAISMAFALLAIVGGARPASALSMEQAKESCIPSQSVDRSFRGLHAGQERRPRGRNMAACRASSFGKVKACTIAALNAANGRANVAIELHKSGAPKADLVAPGSYLLAGFVAPPRTIADITAILDSEKPDPAALVKLKAAATI